MPMYLSRFSYTPETWSRLVQNPEDRRQARRKSFQWEPRGVLRLNLTGRYAV